MGKGEAQQDDRGGNCIENQTLYTIAHAKRAQANPCAQQELETTV